MSYTKESLIAACVLIASAAGYWYLLGPQSGFSDTDIAAVRGSIKNEFEKREGVTFIDVQ